VSEAKEYLEQIKWYDVLIDSKLEELATLNGMVKRITPVMNTTGGGASGNQDKLGDTIAKIVDLQEEINRDVDMFVDMKKEASKLLKKVKRPEFYQVLHKRYILGESLERITLDMGYTHRGMCYLHGRALQAFGKVLEEHNVLEDGTTKKIKAKKRV
jgi:hypothetical protein